MGQLGPNSTKKPSYFWHVNNPNYIIMKTLKLFNMVMLSMAVLLVSFSGEDGEPGLPGPAGANGNANVKSFSVDVSDYHAVATYFGL